MRLIKTLSNSLFAALLLMSLAMVATATPWDGTPDDPTPAQAIWVDPKNITGVDIGDTFVVDVLVNITDPPGAGTGLWGWQYQLGWDSAVLEVVEVQTHGDNNPSGDLLPGHTSVMVADNTTTASNHTYLVAPMSGVAFTGVDSLCTYKFKVIGEGSCALDLIETGKKQVKLTDDAAGLLIQGTPPIGTIVDGYFNNLSPIKLYVYPPKIINPDLVPCENFTIDINILNVSNLYSWEFKLYYDHFILNGTSVTEGTFLSTSGTTSFMIKEFKDAFNATHGLVWVNCTLLAPPPVSGSGTLATISFHVEALGESVLHLASTTLHDPWNGLIPHYTVDGYFNNVLKAHLYVDPSSIIDPTLLPPAYFNITIKVANVTDLYDYQFKLGYDTAVLNCLGVIIVPFENETNFITQLHVDDAAGFIWVNVTYYPPAEPLTTTDPATLALVFFQVEGMGSTFLHLYDTRLSDTLDGEIPHDTSDGFISIVEHDVAIICIVLSTNMTYAGREVYINVTVVNEGDTPESFNVSTYYNDTLIDSLPVTDLLPNTNTTLTFTWNTTGTTPCSNYTIKAEASEVPYEIDLADNTCIGGKVKIKMLGDINGDGTIDIVDLTIVALALWSQPGDSKWNPDADLNGDGVVDIVDLTYVGVHIGETC